MVPYFDFRNQLYSFLCYLSLASLQVSQRERYLLSAAYFSGEREERRLWRQERSLEEEGEDEEDFDLEWCLLCFFSFFALFDSFYFFSFLAFFLFLQELESELDPDYDLEALSLMTGLYSTESQICFIFMGLFQMAFLAFTSQDFIANRGSQWILKKSQHIWLVIYSLVMCLTSFWGFPSVIFFPSRYSSAVFSPWPFHSYIQSSLSSWEAGIWPAFTCNLLIQSWCRSSSSFFFISSALRMSYLSFCSLSQTIWMFFIEPGCQTFFMRQSRDMLKSQK